MGGESNFFYMASAVLKVSASSAASLRAKAGELLRVAQTFEAVAALVDTLNANTVDKVLLTAQIASIDSIISPLKDVVSTETLVHAELVNNMCAPSTEPSVTVQHHEGHAMNGYAPDGSMYR